MGGRRTPAERYDELRLAEALAHPYDYPSACHELGLVLRLAYARLPKDLQSVVFRDTLAAFGLLPQMQMGHGIKVATVLIQAAEVALPKQKKAIAVSEFKRAVVAYKRRGKAQVEGGRKKDCNKFAPKNCLGCIKFGFGHLPHDVLPHIFSYLDMRSLVNASSVCWSWNLAASDNTLWKMLYGSTFGICSISPSEETTDQLVHSKNDMVIPSSIGGHDPISKVNWKEAFKMKYKGEKSWKFSSNRAVCRHCKSIMWLSTITCSSSHNCTRNEQQKLNIKPISPQSVVEYLLGESMLEESSDSDDGDHDGLWKSKLWRHPSI